MILKCEKQKVYKRGFCISHPFFIFCISQHFVGKVKGFHGLFFRGIKPATHYSSLFTKMTKLLFCEKIEFHKTWRKEVYTLFVIGCSSCKCVQQLRYGEKIFKFVKNPPTSANAFCKKVFNETLANLVNHSLHTICICHCSLISDGKSININSTVLIPLWIW